MLLSSTIAGIATAPISAFHFNQIAQYGLAANLASVPAMGLLVMPSAVLAILLSPIGLDGFAWAAMGAGIDWILFVAGKVAALEGAVIKIVKPANFVLVIIGLGALILVLFRSRLRFFALVPILAAVLAWGLTVRPEILLSANGRLVGVMGERGRALNREKGTGFVARNWLENDGDPANQQMAWARFSVFASTSSDADQMAIEGIRVGYRWQRDVDPATIAVLCQQFDLIILPQTLAGQNDCELIDKKRLKRLGSVAITDFKGELRIKGARQITGRRLWSR